MARKPAEQRVSPRIEIAAPATIRWGEERLSGLVEEVNLAGMYVAASRFPEPGDYVDLIFSLPGNPRHFRVRASVVHIDSGVRHLRPGFGARFERPALGFLEAIRDLDKGH